MTASEDSHNGAWVGVVGGPAIATAFDSLFVIDETCRSHVRERVLSYEACRKSEGGESRVVVDLYYPRNPNTLLDKH